MSAIQPTPETDQHQNAMNNEDFDVEMAKTYTLARKLERERDEAREALSGRTVSCSLCNEAAKQLEAMRSAFLAAKAFIDCHVADPDITSQMVQTYAAYQEAFAKIKPLLP